MKKARLPDTRESPECTREEGVKTRWSLGQSLSAIAEPMQTVPDPMLAGRAAWEHSSSADDWAAVLETSGALRFRRALMEQRELIAAERLSETDTQEPRGG